MKRHIKFSQNKPYKPVADLAAIYAYRPEDAATHTASPLVNAVVDALYTTKIIYCSDMARYLGIESQNTLSGAILLETGMSLQDLIQTYRIHQARVYMEQHPDASQDEVAQAIGYRDCGSLWRLFQRELKQTPTGKTSQAGPERCLEIRKKLVDRR